jgi:hypothetical protein
VALFVGGGGFRRQRWAEEGNGLWVEGGLFCGGLWFALFVGGGGLF